jgi:hypothetical protein
MNLFEDYIRKIIIVLKLLIKISDYNFKFQR